MSRILYLFTAFLLCSCINSTEQNKRVVDEYNHRSYVQRYVDIDSALYYANLAYSVSNHYADGRAEARTNLAFVAYQQMRYDQSLRLLREVMSSSRSQIELLCADVLNMKVLQRIGRGSDFFTSRNRAIERLSRIDEDYQILSPRQRERVEYARSELHIVSSTYFYYLGQDSAAISEINLVSQAEKLDTAQAINLDYMLGSGGLVQGSPDEVILKEFTYLIQACSRAHQLHHVYFEANSLQALATMLGDSATHSLVVRERPGGYEYLRSQHQSWATPDIDGPMQLPLAMAMHALSLFKEYKDLFQSACVHRTLGELYFKANDYQNSLSHFLVALHLVQSQHSRSSTTVTTWKAGVYERLSLVYSALDDKPSSDYYRNLYLDQLDSSRQNIELNAHKVELLESLNSVRVQLMVFLVLLVCSVVLLTLLVRRIRHCSIRNMDKLLQIRNSDSYLQMANRIDEFKNNLEDSYEEASDVLRLSQMHIDEYKSGNAERRAKVSLVYSVVPYLDRVLDSVNRLSRNEGQVYLEYISELSQEIMHINDVLTDWIQMQQGKLKLNVTIFPLQSLLDIVAKGRYSFEQKGVAFQVDATQANIRADKTLTLFMINTLADNARKFTPSGGTVHVEVQETDEYVEIAVTDTGVGMSEKDVETLNTSKIFDPSKLGQSCDNKGFGFGIMNCKGIIGKYRKVSSLFNACDFGVSSQQGQGSRFWFRLPRVLSLVFLLIVSNLVDGRTCKEYYDSLYSANINGYYEDAVYYGGQALSLVEEPVDTALLMNIHNEIAIASLAVKDWNKYNYHNSECVRLHYLYTQDSTLEMYCQEISQLRADGRVLYVLLVLSSVLALFLFYFLFLRSRIRDEHLFVYVQKTIQDFFDIVQPQADDVTLRQQMQETHSNVMKRIAGIGKLEQNTQELYDDVVSRLDSIRKLEAQIENVESQRQHMKYEEDRLYVMNQILDNCLSTIKHETMYYPARTLQMVQAMIKDGVNSESVAELKEFVTYYRDVYLLLYSQASRQLEQNSFHRTSVDLKNVFTNIADRVSKRIQRGNLPCEIAYICDNQLHVLADAELLRSMIMFLVLPSLEKASRILLSASAIDSIVRVSLNFQGVSLLEEQATHLFDADSAHIPYLIARQILREHDSYSGHPGLRLYAETENDHFSIQFTLKQS